MVFSVFSFTASFSFETGKISRQEFLDGLQKVIMFVDELFGLNDEVTKHEVFIFF